MNAPIPSLPPDPAARLTAAAERLTHKSVLRPGDSISIRLAGQGALLLREIGQAGESVHVPLAPLSHDETIARHQRLYAARGDVGAITFTHQTWATALRWTGQAMPGVFDEQVRHLGRQVGMLSRTCATADDLKKLNSGANAFLLDDEVMCLGMTVERLVFNTELLEKCAKAYVLACSTDLPVGRIPWWVRYIANRRLRKDEQRAAAAFAAGQEPVMSSAY